MRKITPERACSSSITKVENQPIKFDGGTHITLRIPVDVVESMKAIAQQRGFSGYQTLQKLFLSDGLRKDEAQLMADSTTRLFASLKKRGVAQEVLDDAARELVSA